jgi:hypothetical protein
MDEKRKPAEDEACAGSNKNLRKRYTLQELLDQGDPKAPFDSDRDWLESPPIGRELI